MNACATLLMGLAVLGYQPDADEPVPLPVPPVEEAAPAPQPVEQPAPQPMPDEPRAIELRDNGRPFDGQPELPVPQSAPIDAFAPKPAPLPETHVFPSVTPHPQGMLTFPGAIPTDGSIPFDVSMPFGTEAGLMPIPMTHTHAGTACGNSCSCACGQSATTSRRHCCWLGKCCENSTCDMPSHLPYFPAYHGYYYFRPYNHLHIAEHQAVVASLGGDSRAPYATTDFARFYEAFPPGFGEALPTEPNLRPLSRPLPNLEALLHGPAAP